MQKLYEIINQQTKLDSNQVQAKVDECIAIIKKLPITRKYHYQSPELISFYHKFKLSDYSAFHKMVVLNLIKSFQFDALPFNLPQSIVDLYKSEFIRITHIIETDNNYIFDWRNDLFAKDMGICSYRLIPTGAQYLEVSGFPRSVIIRNVSNFFKALRFFMLERRHFKPCFEIHTHLGNLSDFHSEGWDRCYVRIGQLLKLNPNIKGMLGGSWFYDPKLGIVSPRLKYLRDVPCRSGAEIFYVSKEGKNSGALSRSKSRLKLFEEGKYTPKSYLLIWPRKEVITFAEENKELITNPSTSSEASGNN